MDEPERGKRKHHGVDPDGQWNQHQKSRGKHHTRSPHHRGRGAQKTADHAHQQQAAAVAQKNRLALGLAGMFGQRIKGHDPVGQPAPDQGRQHQHQRRNEPQGNGHQQHGQRQRRGAGGPGQAGQQRGTLPALELQEPLRRHQLHQRRHHQKRHRQERHQHQQGRGQHRHQQRGNVVGRMVQSPALQPAPERAQQAGSGQPVAHQRHRRLPEEIPQPERQHAGQQQRHQRQHHHARAQAVRQRTPKGIKQRPHKGDKHNGDSRPPKAKVALARPCSRLPCERQRVQGLWSRDGCSGNSLHC